MASMFDQQSPIGERFPASIEADFFAYPGALGSAVHLTVNGQPVTLGSDDAAVADSGWRWHGALHLALATCLGWSPVLRTQMGLTRASTPEVARVEDGDRAVMAETAIVWMLFTASLSGRHLNRTTLDGVEALTFGLEVADCTRRDWRNAVAAGVGCMRTLATHGGGQLLGDLQTGMLTVLRVPVNRVPATA